MSNAADVCTACSAKFDEAKGIIQCSLCESYYHGKCEGIQDLRGYRKKSSWRCTKCIDLHGPVSVPASDPEVIRRKRLRSNQNNVIEIDCAVIHDLMEKIDDLTKITSELNKKVDSLTVQNQRLEFALSLVAAPKKKTTSLSYAGVVEKTQQQNPLIIKPILNQSKDSSVTLSPPLRNEEDMSSPQMEIDGNQFTTVNRKTKKKRPINKKVLVGSAETKASDDSGNGNGSSQLTGTERRHWVYVGRVTAGTSPETVAEHVKATFDITDVKCVQLSKRDEFSSFKVGVKESLIKSLLDATKWPKYVAVREFVHFPRNGSSAKPSTGNFPQSSQVSPPT